MAKPVNIRRFRANPVEVLILSAVTVLFFRSVYNLVYDSQGFQSIQLAGHSQMNTAAERSPASVSSTFFNLEVKCDKNTDQDTGANKVRLTGTLCGSSTTNDTSKLVKTVVTNGANKFTATVFTDVNSGKYSTDYIPPNVGQNPIRVEFAYRDGKSFVQELNVLKN